MIEQSAVMPPTVVSANCKFVSNSTDVVDAMDTETTNPTNAPYNAASFKDLGSCTPRAETSTRAMANEAMANFTIEVFCAFDLYRKNMIAHSTKNATSVRCKPFLLSARDPK